MLRSKSLRSVLLAWTAFGMLACPLALGVHNVSAGHDADCYLVGDSTHVLTRVKKTDTSPLTNETTIGSTGTTKTDAMTAEPNTGTLYAANTIMHQNSGYLGTLNPATGAFTSAGQPFGTAAGSLGAVNLFDVSGLSFDPATGILYGIHIRVGEGAADVLFQVNPTTGAFVPNAFGPGHDYRAVGPHPQFTILSDVDDIAFDPITGQLYAVINSSNSGDRLIKIDKHTGAITDVGPFNVAEVEGLSFDTHGRLWATAGGTAGTEANKLYEVDKATGAAANPRGLDNSYNYEALACLLPVLHVHRLFTPVALR